MALDQLKEYWRPADMSQALALLSRPSPRTVPLAGGAYLAVQRDPGVEAVVDLSALGLDSLHITEAEARIGAMVCLDDLATGAVPGPTGRLLAEAARRQTSWQIRRSGTVGGTLVTGALPELDAALWALDAQVLLQGESARAVPFGAFLEERNHLAPGTVVTAVVAPCLAPNEGASAARAARTPADAPAVATVGYVKRAGHRAVAARLVVTGLALNPIRVVAAEEALADETWPDMLIDRALAAAGASTVPDDIRGSAPYRAAMFAVCARRALATAWTRAVQGRVRVGEGT